MSECAFATKNNTLFLFEFTIIAKYLYSFGNLGVGKHLQRLHPILRRYLQFMYPREPVNFSNNLAYI